MSKQVKLLYKDSRQYGRSMNLPDMPNTAIADDGSVEVSEEIAEQLIESNPTDWEYFDKKKAPVKKTSKVEDLETEDDDLNGGKEDEKDGGEKPDEDQMDKELRILFIRKFKGEEGEVDLKKLAEDHGVTKTVINKAKGKTDLINMILSKLSVEDKAELIAAESKTEE